MRGLSGKLVSLGVTTLAIAALAVVLFPLTWVISSSLRPYSSLYTTQLRLVPTDATLGAFRAVLQGSGFWLYLKNSLIAYVVALTCSLLVTVPAAYGFSRFQFLGKEPILYSYFILTQFMGGMSVIGLIGLYLFLARLRLTNSLPVLGLVYAANTVPFVTWYLKTYFDSVPRDFEVAALIDGASFLQSLYYVLIPIARPGLLVAATFVSVITWGEWVMAGMLLGSDSYTVPVGLVTLQGRWETPWNRFAAMSIIYSLPLIVLFMLSRRYMEAGLTLGGIKG